MQKDLIFQHPSKGIGMGNLSCHFFSAVGGLNFRIVSARVMTFMLSLSRRTFTACGRVRRGPRGRGRAPHILGTKYFYLVPNQDPHFRTFLDAVPNLGNPLAAPYQGPGLMAEV